MFLDKLDQSWSAQHLLADFRDALIDDIHVLRPRHVFGQQGRFHQKGRRRAVHGRQQKGSRNAGNEAQDGRNDNPVDALPYDCRQMRQQIRGHVLIFKGIAAHYTLPNLRVSPTKACTLDRLAKVTSELFA